ncbi:alcohol dehydrogenase catalytic domain-containing protein [Streptomyces sp. NPDC091272]|uniref:alcohol dehydrogenase catalytic domain-containing protein n=1 Tax=Streptomyces sp. NPDC091272 TaxID=3365981 RepID=UPI00382A65DA
MTDTMKALLLGRGPQWALDDVPVPEPGRGEVLVRNRAAATNNADLPMLAAADPIHGGTGEESVAGFEYAGEIAAVGGDAGRWKVGDPVMGTFPSSFTEYLVADHRFVLPRPKDLARKLPARCPPRC